MHTIRVYAKNFGGLVRLIRGSGGKTADEILRDERWDDGSYLILR